LIRPVIIDDLVLGKIGKGSLYSKMPVITQAGRMLYRISTPALLTNPGAFGGDVRPRIQVRDCLVQEDPRPDALKRDPPADSTMSSSSRIDIGLMRSFPGEVYSIVLDIDATVIVLDTVDPKYSRWCFVLTCVR